MTDRFAEPYFSSPPTTGSPGRRMLLLSYHFPPGQAVGALRWQKMAHVANERGWEMDVVTLDPDSLASRDPEALRQLPPGMRLYGVRQPNLFRERVEHGAWRLYSMLRPRRRPAPTQPKGAGPAQGLAAAEPAATELNWRLSSLRDWKRAYYASLDNARDRRWAAGAAQLARRLTEQNRYVLLATCGPPHMVHWAGQAVAAEAGIPFVMDLRDPWSQVERLADDIASPVWYRLAERFERQAVAGARLVVMNSEPAREAMCRAYPELAPKIMTVMNGYDEPGAAPAPARSKLFLMVFAGSISLDRSPRLLLRAAARAVRELALAPSDFRIEFVGNVGSLDPDDPDSIGALARAEGLEGHVGVSGFRPRGELAALLANATVLVSLYQDSRSAIPSKIFEYMQYDAWILTFAEPDSATEMLLRGSDADVLAPRDLEGLVQTLTQRYRQFSAGARPVRLARDPAFSRRTQANRLFDRLEALAPVHSARDEVVQGALAG